MGMETDDAADALGDGGAVGPATASVAANPAHPVERLFLHHGDENHRECFPVETPIVRTV